VSSPTDVLVVGAGGHALVGVEVLRSAGYTVGRSVAREAATPAALARLSVEVIGRDDQVPTYVASGMSTVFVAIGDNRARHQVTRQILQSGGSLVTAVSPAAHVSPTARIGSGALVMPGAVVNALAEVGEGAIVNTGAVVEHECVVGDFAHVAPGSVLAGNVRIGEGALVGAGATVTPGRSVGAWAVVGAGAVVTTDVPDGATVVGVPARLMVRHP
jgi:UDP-perosamine 4-acetyltransferase